MAEFDLQRFLETMRAEQRVDHTALTVKVDSGFETANKQFQQHQLEDQAMFSSFSKRLDPLEGNYKAMRWFTRACVIAAIGMLFDVFANHVAPTLIQLLTASQKHS